jgi:hypothetical protein
VSCQDFVKTLGSNSIQESQPRSRVSVARLSTCAGRHSGLCQRERGGAAAGKPQRRRVDLYVLDMYFPNEGMNTPEELSKLGKAWDALCTAEDTLKTVLAELGQSSAGGRTLATQIASRHSFARTPFVFFTRKGTLLDAIEAYEHTGALAVIKKPDPRQPVDEAQRTQAYNDAMISNSDSLIRALESAIHRASLWYRYKAQFPGFVSGVASSTLVWFITWWIT